MVQHVLPDVCSVNLCAALDVVCVSVLACVGVSA